jgi:hypothetical protein
MLTQAEVDDIIIQEVITDIQAIGLIRKFIFDKTGKDIKGINRPVGMPTIITDSNGRITEVMTDIELMFKMFFVAKSHYLEIKK